jgi:hypothetical protein
MSTSVLSIPPLLAGLGLQLSASAVYPEAHIPREDLARLVSNATNPVINPQTVISAAPLIARKTLHHLPDEFLAMRFTNDKPAFATSSIQFAASAVRVGTELPNRVVPFPTKLPRKSHKRQGPPKEKPARNLDLLTPAEAAAFLGKAEGTLTNWRSLKKGPPWRKHEGGIFYSRATLVRWSENHEVHPGHERKRPGRKVLGL